MKHQEKETVNKPITIVLREWQTCDICGAEIIEKDFETKEGRVLLKISVNYGGLGGFAKYYRADLCAECFVNRLVPWLESQGVTMQTEEVDW